MAKSIESEVRQYAPKALTSTAHLLLLSLADSANHDGRMVWLSNATLVHDTRSCERSVQNAYKQLAELNIVKVVPEADKVARAQGWKTIVRIINPVPEWAAIYDRNTGTDVRQDADPAPSEGADPAPPQGADPAPPQNLHPRNSCAQTPAESAPKPNTSNQEQENPKQKTSSSAYPGRARGPRRQALTEKAVTRRSKSRGQDPDAEFDASKIVDEDRHPAPRPGIRDSDPDSALGLVKNFRDAMQQHPAAREQMQVPDAINWGAMVESLSRWLTSGTAPDQIRAMIDAYASQHTFRAHSIAPWQDFLAARVRLFKQLADNPRAHMKPGSPEALAYYGLTEADVKPFDTGQPTLSQLRAEAVAASKARRALQLERQAA